MESQSQIKRRLSEPSAIAQIKALLETGAIAGRAALARKLCEQFGFHDARGRAQLSGCMKALSELSAAGHFVLPPPRSQPKAGSPRGLPSPVPAPVNVPATVGQIDGLELQLVESESQLRVWNELMAREHPCGAGPLVGPQLRYLIGSAHGWLGGFGFAAAAINLAARDAWIGWDHQTRRAQLHRVVGMSRFLLRPRGCRNLASHVLGQVMGRLADDFEAKFGYRPYLLESFVDTSRFDGACYRAANFVHVGRTCGRGRQDRGHEHKVTIKDIYLYALLPDFRQHLGLRSGPGWTPLAAGEGLDSAHWAEQEFGGAPLRDARLSRRLVASAARLAEQPGRAFSAIAQSDMSAIKGYYRLIDQPDLDAVNLDTILVPHQQRTRQRMANESRVLCIADGTTLDYNNLAECEGLGIISTNQTGARSRGIKLHSTLAVNDRGIPLGIVDVRTRLPEADPPKTTPKTPIEKKKSYDWVASLRACTALAAQLPDTAMTCVMDREADFFELFDAQRQAPGVDLLVRAKYNRQTTSSMKLFERMRASSSRGTVQLEVKRQSARPKRSKQQARPARAPRTATLDLHYEKMEFAPPKHLKTTHKNLELWVVHAREQSPPAEVPPLEWCLLTSRKIKGPADAEQCLSDYALRWRIEDWHRVLKTGCRVEELAHERVERLERAIAINLVIAWRIMVMTLLGREVPELPAEVLFADIEIQVLAAWAGTVRAKAPATLGEAILLVARMGGYTNRKSDPPPGHELMWYGYQNLTMMAIGYSLRGP